MPEKPTTVARYLAALPKDRRNALAAIRKVIRANLGAGYKEGVQYGMIGYFVPHSVYPPGYHCDRDQPLPYLSLASQKNHMALYLFCVYTSEEEQRWFREAWTKSGKKLDMGKSCVRFKKIEDVPLDVVARLLKRTPVKKYVAGYEAAFVGGAGKKKKKKKTAATPRKTAAKKAPGRKTTTKKAARKTARSR